MPEKLDPRLMSIWENEQKHEQKRRPKEPLSLEKFQQNSESKHRIVAEKRKEQRIALLQDSATKPQTEPQKTIKGDLEEYDAIQRPLDAVNAQVSSTTGTTPHSVAPPGTNQGLPSLYNCAKLLMQQVPLIIFQGNLYGYNGRCYDFLYPKDVIRLYREKVDIQLGGEKSMGRSASFTNFSPRTVTFKLTSSRETKGLPCSKMVFLT